MAIVSMTQALMDGDKVFVGDVPVHITAPGKMGMMIGAGDTLQKLVQIIALRNLFGGEPADINDRVDQVTPLATEVILECNLFAECDFDLGNLKKPFADEEQSDRRNQFYSAVGGMVLALTVLMDLAKVDTERERGKMEAVMGGIRSGNLGDMKMNQAAQASPMGMAPSRRY